MIRPRAKDSRADNKLDVRPDDIWGDFHVTDGRVVTGTNPQSAASTAKEVLKVFESL